MMEAATRRVQHHQSAYKTHEPLRGYKPRAQNAASTPVDFDALMAQAARNAVTAGSSSSITRTARPAPIIQKQQTRPQPVAIPAERRLVADNSRPKQPPIVARSSKTVTTSSMSKAASRDSRPTTTKPPPPRAAVAAVPQPERRYLPGDLRYKPPLPSASSVASRPRPPSAIAGPPQKVASSLGTKATNRGDRPMPLIPQRPSETRGENRASASSHRPAASRLSTSTARPSVSSRSVVATADASHKTTTRDDRSINNRDNRPKPTTQQKASRQEPAAPQPQRRFLPGDLRYQPPPAATRSFKPAAIVTKTVSVAVSSKSTSRGVQPSSSKSQPLQTSSRRIDERMSTASRRLYQQPLPAASHASYQRPLPAARPSAQHYDRRPQPLPSYRRHHVANDYSDDNDEDDRDDDEYSNDSFIDDSDIHELHRSDFDDTLKMLNKNYDRDLWRRRERLIDDRRMDARYRDVEAEERRSARMALVEDLEEARKGSRGIG